MKDKGQWKEPVRMRGPVNTTPLATTPAVPGSRPEGNMPPHPTVELDVERKEELILAKQLRACRVSILPRVGSSSSFSPSFELSGAVTLSWFSFHKTTPTC